jgi:hypothetical protein
VRGPAAERDDAGFGVAAAERNDPITFGVTRCRKNAKNGLQVALPARWGTCRIVPEQVQLAIACVPMHTNSQW